MNTRESDFWNERSGPRIAPEHFGDIVATAADVAIVLSENGRIISITTNPLNSAMGDVSHWDGRKISEFLAPDSVDKVLTHLTAVLKDDAARPEAIEVNHIDGAIWDFPVRYTLHQTGRDGRVLMLGRDLRPVAELQQRLVRAQIALEKDYEAQRVFETRYRVLLEATTDPLVLVDVQSGRILDLNLAASTLMGGSQSGFLNSAFTQEFEGKRRADFIDELCTVAQDDVSGSVRVFMRRASDEISIVPTLFRNAGERVLLCRLTESDADAIARIADPLVDGLIEIFRSGSDAIIFSDAEGRITHANDAFLSLMDVNGVSDLRGRSIADLLSRGSVDLKMILDDQQVAAYGTRLVTRYGTHLPVEITSTAVKTAAGGEGRGYVVRNVAKASELREGGPDQNPGGSTVGMSNAMSLVGSAPLRDIVASMTDVIERQCIETAVELTNNNRVAAAEMLGLSRQSLYVKLRKYGLLQRDEN